MRKKYAVQIKFVVQIDSEIILNLKMELEYRKLTINMHTYVIKGEFNVG